MFEEPEDDKNYLQLTYRGSEWTPDRVTRYMVFSVRIRSGDFTGATEFETTSQYIEYFKGQLLAYHSSLGKTDVPELQCGWGDCVLFFLKLSPHFLECKVVASTVPYSNSVHVFQGMEFNKIAEMALFFKYALASTEPVSDTFVF